VHALHKVVIGYDAAGPQRIHKFVLGDEPAGMLSQVAQDSERLWPQGD
jgi:hypothetical protein